MSVYNTANLLKTFFVPFKCRAGVHINICWRKLVPTTHAVKLKCSERVHLQMPRIKVKMGWCRHLNDLAPSVLLPVTAVLCFVTKAFVAHESDLVRSQAPGHVTTVVTLVVTVLPSQV